jgi:ribonuclease E
MARAGAENDEGGSTQQPAVPASPAMAVSAGGSDADTPGAELSVPGQTAGAADDTPGGHQADEHGPTDAPEPTTAEPGKEEAAVAKIEDAKTAERPKRAYNDPREIRRREREAALKAQGVMPKSSSDGRG